MGYIDLIAEQIIVEFFLLSFPMYLIADAILLKKFGFNDFRFKIVIYMEIVNTDTSWFTLVARAKILTNNGSISVINLILGMFIGLGAMISIISTVSPFVKEVEIVSDNIIRGNFGSKSRIKNIYVLKDGVFGKTARLINRMLDNI